jgi:hypothetical protein
LLAAADLAAFFAAAFAWDSKPAQMSDQELDNAAGGIDSIIGQS